MQKIKVLLVDDSLLFRESLKLEISKTPDIQVVGTCVDATDAFEKIPLLKPDVVTMDVEMPGMNGIDFIKKLLPVYPVPVVVVSSLPINVLDALSAGAVDFVRKPRYGTGEGFGSFINELIVKIKVARSAHIRTVKLPSAPIDVPIKGFSNDTLIAIGASTGGTEAILEVVRDLPENTPGVVIVQHMPPVFTQMYAERLNKICKMSVKEAVNGDRVTRGQIIIAAGDYHLRLAKDAKGYFVKSENGPKVSGHCPSVDVLFESVASVAGNKAIGVILTGMGADGAKGLLSMKNNGAFTIGQDQESSVVYGMPMVAFNVGAVSKQLPLSMIGAQIVKSVSNI